MERGDAVRRKWILAGVAALVLAVSVGVAVASHVAQVDPATVPVGFLATHNDVSNFDIAPLARVGSDGDVGYGVLHAVVEGGERQFHSV